MDTTPELEAMQRVSEYAERYKQGCIKLSSAIDRIDYACGDPNDMEVSDYAIHQNEEQVVRRVSEKLEAMREAIKEAHDALDNCVDFINDAHIIEAQWQWEPVKQSRAALTKLQPFLKP